MMRNGQIMEMGANVQGIGGSEMSWGMDQEEWLCRKPDISRFDS